MRIVEQSATRDNFRMVSEWLNSNAPGYERLSQDEKDALMHFSLLWSLFEAKVLNASATVCSIEEKISEWHKSGSINEDEFDQFKVYFVNRYIKNGKPNELFSRLRLRSGDKPCLVKAVLVGGKTDLPSIVTAILIIVRRYRNNFFHGTKWDYEFQEQLENFRTANNVLMKSIEINNRR